MAFHLCLNTLSLPGFRSLKLLLNSDKSEASDLSPPAMGWGKKRSRSGNAWQTSGDGLWPVIGDGLSQSRTELQPARAEASSLNQWNTMWRLQRPPDSVKSTPSVFYTLQCLHSDVKKSLETQWRFQSKRLLFKNSEPLQGSSHYHDTSTGTHNKSYNQHWSVYVRVVMFDQICSNVKCLKSHGWVRQQEVDRLLRQYGFTVSHFEENACLHTHRPIATCWMWVMGVHSFFNDALGNTDY